MKESGFPLIKEYRLTKLVDCMKCIYEYPYSRVNQSECILKSYPVERNKPLEQREKSILRGMVLPSLGHLGLIIGFAEYIRISANGKLIVESYLNKNKLYKQILGAVFLEIDIDKFQLLSKLLNDSCSYELLVDKYSNLEVSHKSLKERIYKWCSLLREVKLITIVDEIITLNTSEYNIALNHLGINKKKKSIFLKLLLEGYNNLSNESAGIVNITELRGIVSKLMLEKFKLILTEGQFDILLNETEFLTSKYIIYLGQPMGTDEKLFKHNGEYYKTLSINYTN